MTVRTSLLQPADPTFTRLLLDISLAGNVEQKIKRGYITATADQIDSVKRVEAESFAALAGLPLSSSLRLQ